MEDPKVVRTKSMCGVKCALWAVACATFVVLAACTSPPDPSNPPSEDPGAPTDTGANVGTGCDCQTAPTKVRGSGQGDWPQGAEEQAALWEWWVDEGDEQGSGSWTKLGNFTNGYNCAGFIYASSSCWVNTLGTEDDYLGTTSGCWKSDASGTIRISDEHVCNADYTGKVGRGPKQDHNDDIYGTMANRYSLVP